MRFTEETINAINKSHWEIIRNLAEVGHDFHIEIDEEMNVLANSNRICKVNELGEIIIKLRTLADVIKGKTGIIV